MSINWPFAQVHTNLFTYVFCSLEYRHRTSKGSSAHRNVTWGAACNKMWTLLRPNKPANLLPLRPYHRTTSYTLQKRNGREIFFIILSTTPRPCSVLLAYSRQFSWKLHKLHLPPDFCLSPRCGSFLREESKNTLSGSPTSLQRHHMTRTWHGQLCEHDSRDCKKRQLAEPRKSYS